MRLFQNSSIPPGYRSRLNSLSRSRTTFADRLSVFLDNRYGASHFLLPVLCRDGSAFFTNGDDSTLQRAWADENGVSGKASLETILLLQIEEHRSEVFYNLDPISYDGGFAKRLPGCVKKRICWRAAPSPGANFAGYDLVVCNFPSIIESWRRLGLRSEYFVPGHDPLMDAFSTRDERSLDVTFVGGYSRHHARRAKVLESVADLADRYRIVFCLDRSRLNRASESPLGLLPPLRRHRRPAAIRRVSADPLFGIDMYRLIARSKIVLNCAIDMSGPDRGNMRCFEAMGCGSLLVSDQGHYPRGMLPGQNMLDYDSPVDAVNVIGRALADWPRHREMAKLGNQNVRTNYTKEYQWQLFQKLLEVA